MARVSEWAIFRHSRRNRAVCSIVFSVLPPDWIACQSRFVTFQADNLDKSGTGGNLFAGFDLNDVSRDKVGVWYDYLVSAKDHP